MPRKATPTNQGRRICNGIRDDIEMAAAGGTSLVALAAIPSAGATTFTFTGEIVDITVPVTAGYQIIAFGAQGGTASSFSGGKGAEIGGDFILTAAEVL
jgi:hypothetical protein